MILNGAGTYRPSSYEALQAGWQSSSMQSLMDYAALNSARAQAAQRMAVKTMFGGSVAQQQQMLYGTTGGAMIRYGSQFTEGLFGSGSYVDMMAGLMNISQQGGLAASAFGRNATTMYGAGPVADIAARRMFDHMQNYFSNAGSGTDNLDATQGLSMTQLAALQQTMAAKGRFYGLHMTDTRKAGLVERARVGARDLEAQGNVLGAETIRNALAAGGTEEEIAARLRAITTTAGVSGDIKGVIESTLKTSSVTVANQQAMEKMGKDTTEMAKVINKLRNIYGDIAETDVFNAASNISASKDPATMLRDLERFQREARVQGYGDNLTGYGTMQAGVKNALSSVFGSDVTGSGFATDITSRIITQQRLAAGSQANLTPDQIAQSVIEDVGVTSQETNFKELVRLAFEAENSGDPLKKAAAKKLAERMRGNLDIESQYSAIAEARAVIGDSPTFAPYADQMQALQDKELGYLVNSAIAGTAGKAKLRTYQQVATQKGMLNTEDATTYTGMVEALGTDRLNVILNGEAINDEDVAFLQKVGLSISKDAANQFVGRNRSALQSVTKDVLAMSKDNTVLGLPGQQNLDRTRSMDAFRNAQFGSGPNSINQDSSFLRLGLNLLLDGNKAITDKDVIDYTYATDPGAAAFNIDPNSGKVSMTDSQMQTLASKYSGLDIEELRKITGKDNGADDLADYLKANGVTMSLNEAGVGITLNQDELVAKKKALRAAASAAAANRLGIGELAGLSDEAKRKKAGEILSRDFAGGWSDLDPGEAALQGITDVINNKGYDYTPEGIAKRQQVAAKLKNLVYESGATPDMDSLGDKILTDEAYSGLRESFGIAGLSKTMREQLAKGDSKMGAELAGFALSQAGGFEPSKEQLAAIEQLRASAGQTQRVGLMIVEKMEYK